MSDETEKEGVVIDVTPEPEEPELDSAPPASAPPHKSGIGRQAPLIVAVIALVLVAAALIFAYRFTRQATQDLASLNARLSTSLEQQHSLESQLADAEKAVAEQAQRLQTQQQRVDAQDKVIDKARQEFSQQGKMLDQERERMQEREAELRASVADVHKRVGASGTQWMVAEAEYLMRMANNRLTLARDVATARAALLLADQRLRDTGDPGWNDTRRQIARDIARLDNAHLPDIAGISARLSALAEEVPQLKLAGATLGGAAHHAAEKDATTPRAKRSWDTLLDDLWAGFKDTVRIRRNDQPVQAMLPPEQQFFLYQNLRLHLETARLAVARGDDTLYHDSLNTVIAWLNAYFDAADPLTRTMRDGVTELNKANVHPPLPDISQSLQALLLRQKLNADLARPIAPPAEPAQ